jgi:hypothetical protein
MCLLSIAMLGIQIAWTRIFSFMIWYHFAFLVISIAMLGFSVGGLSINLRPQWLAHRSGILLPSAFAFAATSAGSLLGVCNLPLNGGVLDSLRNFALFLVLVLLMAASFLAAGLFVAAMIVQRARRGARVRGEHGRLRSRLRAGWTAAQLTARCAALCLLLYRAGLDAALQSTLALALSVRIAMAVGLLALPALLMGMPFPLAMSQLAAAGPTGKELVIRGWVVNGYCSVLGSCLAMMLAISFGFGFVLLAGAAAYALASWLWLSAFRHVST